jgi:ABC-2 type transport system permease protein
MTTIALALHQFRYDQKVFWRNPAAVFFTVMLPLIFLFIFATIFGDQTVDGRGGIKVTAYYVPSIIALSVIAATMVGLAFRLVELRESGMLKRVRGTPLPGGIFVASRVGNSIVISLLMAALVSVIGRIVYGVRIPFGSLPAILVTLLIGAATFSCLGFALAALIPSEDSAPAITNAVALPLYFISGIFIPDDQIPGGVLGVADAFPVRHFFEALFAAYDPGSAGTTLEFGHLGVVAAWGIAAAIVALLLFRWEPRER